VFLARRSVLAGRDGSIDLSLQAQVGDLDAVIDRLQVQSVDLWGTDDGCALTVAWSAREPDRVSHLVLWGAYARTKGSSDPVVRALIDVARGNWPLARRSFADLNFPSGPEEQRAWFADYHRRSFSPDATARFLEFSADADLREDLQRVAAPTLVLHRRGDRVVALRAARSAAGLLRDGSLRVLDGDIHVPYFGDTSYLADVEAFLDDRPPLELPSADTSGLRTILFTDVVGHTEIMQQLGDARGREVLRASEQMTRDALRQHRGTEIKSMGDGFMASFTSVSGAVECAIALQRQVARWNAGAHGSASPEMPLSIRIGLNVGEPIEEDGDFFGSTVILASRIAGNAAGGEILIPEPVRHLLAGKAFTFSDRGEFAPKGFDDAVRLYEVHWQEQS
jgi:class 3 adenylate cyclase